MITKEKAERLKRGKSNSKIAEVKYLPRAHQLAILDDQSFSIYSKELEKIQDLQVKDKKEKIIVFCLNMGVYRPPISGQLQSQTDQICVSTDKKRLYIFNSMITGQGCQFFQDNQFYYDGLDSEANQLFWDEERIYCGAMAGFHVINLKGETLIKYRYEYHVMKKIVSIPSFSQERPPLMTVYREKCLVMGKSQKKARFLIEGKDPEGKEDERNQGYMQKKPQFKIDQSRQCVQMLLVEKQYVILVYENYCQIMNANTGDCLQVIDETRLQMNQQIKSKLKFATINIENKNIFLVGLTEKTKNAPYLSQVYLLRETPY